MASLGTNSTLANWLSAPNGQGISDRLLPVLLKRASISGLQKEWLALPTRDGGLGMNLWPDEELEHEYHASQRMCRPLSDEDEWEECEGKKRCIAAQIRSERMQGQQHQAACIHTRLNQDQQHAREVTKEKGASSWLHTRPLVVQGYYLSCNEFRDAIALRMGWTPADLPNTCHCWVEFTTSHALSCVPSVAFQQYVTTRHETYWRT